MDIESSGLNERAGHLLEVALVATDDELKELAAISTLCRPVGIDVDDIQMDDVVREMHTKSGLLEELRASASRRYEAQAVLHAFLQQVESMCPPVEVREGEEPKPPFKDVPLAGNTIAFDRRWTREHMSTIEGMFSHRSIDVSSITELAKRWAPAIYTARPGLGPDGKPVSEHRALPDIRASIETLRYYRKTGFIGWVMPVDVEVLSPTPDEGSQ